MLELLTYCWPILVLLMIFLLIRYMRPFIKGFIGEQFVAIILSLLPKKKYKILHNVHIPHKNGKAQIDHLVISRYGIFVIETKNYKGWIYGDEHSYHWTQVLYTKKYKLYNPIRQNQGHILALRQALKSYPYIPYISMVVFTWKAKLRLDVSSSVIKYYWLYFKIRCHWRKKLTETEVSEIYQHILQIDGEKYKNIAPEPVKPTEVSCPHCYGYLVERKGKFGTFMGCTNYPICTYTERLSSTEALSA